MSRQFASTTWQLAAHGLSLFFLCSASFLGLEYDSLEQTSKEDPDRPLTEDEEKEFFRLQRALRELLSAETSAEEKARAIIILEELEKQGSARAAFCLGLCYLSGEGVKPSLLQATQYLNKSSQEYPPAAYNLAILLWQQGQQNNSVRILERDLLSNHADAQYALGYAMLQGKRIQKDPQRACKLFIRAAKLGSENARAALVALLPVEVIEHNRNEILPLLGEGVQQDHGPSLTAMGYVFGVGLLGALPDPKQAVEFFLKGTAQEHAPAFYEISQCYAKGFGVEADAQRSEQWMLQAALRLEPRALFHYAQQQQDPVLAYALTLPNQSVELVSLRRELILTHGLALAHQARTQPEKFFLLALGLKSQTQAGAKSEASEEKNEIPLETR